MPIYWEYFENQTYDNLGYHEISQIVPNFRYVDGITTVAQLQISPKPVAKSRKSYILFFGKLSEPTRTLIEGWILGAGTSVSEYNRPSYKTACDIHLKHVFLTKLGLWRNPAPKLRHIPFRFFGYHKLAWTVVILNIPQFDIWY